jgi:hypothetical protein
VDLSDAAWRKSSHSGGSGGQCVEVAAITGPETGLAVRDSKDTTGPVLAFGRQAWEAFAAEVKAGRA